MLLSLSAEALLRHVSRREHDFLPASEADVGWSDTLPIDEARWIGLGVATEVEIVVG